jgi:HTH-type transcriptional regulator / antitoxin HigA
MSTAIAIHLDYLRLIRRFPLRPIRNYDEMQLASRIMTRIGGRPDGRMSEGETDYILTLARLMQDYDAAHCTLKPADMTPLQALKYLMKQRKMTVTELGKIVGTHALASMILHGKRQISKANAKALGEFFKVSPGLFI